MILSAASSSSKACQFIAAAVWMFTLGHILLPLSTTAFQLFPMAVIHSTSTIPSPPSSCAPVFEYDMYSQVSRKSFTSSLRQRFMMTLYAISSLEATDSSASFSDDNPQNVTAGTAVTSLSSPGSKLRRLKDIMWVRETLEDLTAAQFACTVEAHDNDAESDSKRKRKRAVDYEKILTKLNKRIREIGCDIENYNSQDETLACELESNRGMGSLTYTNTQRQELLERLLCTRRQLLEFIRGNEIDIEEINSENMDSSFLSIEIPSLDLSKQKKTKDASSSSSSSSSPSMAGPRLYVRDDGTVDWDGALQDQAALRKFGTAVWARINGRDPESVDPENHDLQHSPKEVTAKIVDTPAIKEAREQLDNLSNQLMKMEKEHYKLLNSAISQGQATANVRLATIEPKLRSQIQESAAALETQKVKVSYQTLVYELERIFTYLVGELGNPAITGYIPLPDRLNVAEFGLLESQIDGFNRQFLDNETVDEDVLAVVFDQLTDFKRRLGIDYYVDGFSLDREIISKWIKEIWMNTKKGLTFYAKGVRLFWNDIVFCLRLFNRAVQGYTLKPREVRTLRYVNCCLNISKHIHVSIIV